MSMNEGDKFLLLLLLLGSPGSLLTAIAMHNTIDIDAFTIESR